MTQIRLIRISHDEKWTYLERGGLDGSELDGIMGMRDEYHACVRALLDVFAPFGKNGIEDDCPYYINTYAVADYFPCVEIKDPSIVSLQTVKRVAHAVRHMPPKYRVDICNALGYWNEETSIFIEHDRIFWYAENDEVAKRIGILDLSDLRLA